MKFLDFPNIDFSDEIELTPEQWAIRMYEVKKIWHRLNNHLPREERLQRIFTYKQTDNALKEIEELDEYTEFRFGNADIDFYFRLGVFHGSRR